MILKDKSTSDGTLYNWYRTLLMDETISLGNHLQRMWRDTNFHLSVASDLSCQVKIGNSYSASMHLVSEEVSMWSLFLLYINSWSVEESGAMTCISTTNATRIQKAAV